MTQEEKRLLLRDLSARLPYGVKYCRDSWNFEWDQEMSVVEVLEDIDKDGYINYHRVYKVWDIMPYLRPMSSMTEDERKELLKILNYEFYVDDDFALVAEDDRRRVRLELCKGYIDWLNAHHFDYRGLIPMGLALAAKEGMYML